MGQGSSGTAVPNVGVSYSGNTVFTALQYSGRYGDTTRTKQKGVKFIIKVL